jgi:hypothetical protein
MRHPPVMTLWVSLKAPQQARPQETVEAITASRNF